MLKRIKLGDACECCACNKCYDINITINNNTITVINDTFISSVYSPGCTCHNWRQLYYTDIAVTSIYWCRVSREVPRVEVEGWMWWMESGTTVKSSIQLQFKVYQAFMTLSVLTHSLAEGTIFKVVKRRRQGRWLAERELKPFLDWPYNWPNIFAFHVSLLSSHQYRSTVLINQN